MSTIFLGSTLIRKKFKLLLERSQCQSAFMRKDCNSMTSLTKKFALGNTHQPTDQKLFYTISISPNALYVTSVGSDHKIKSNAFIFCFGLVTRQKNILFSFSLSLFLFLTILNTKNLCSPFMCCICSDHNKKRRENRAKTQHSLVILTKFSNAQLQNALNSVKYFNIYICMYKRISLYRHWGRLTEKDRREKEHYLLLNVII